MVIALLRLFIPVSDALSRWTSCFHDPRAIRLLPERMSHVRMFALSDTLRCVATSRQYIHSKTGFGIKCSLNHSWTDQVDSLFSRPVQILTLPVTRRIVRRRVSESENAQLLRAGTNLQSCLENVGQVVTMRQTYSKMPTP
jgi:hypothetical protein